MRKTVLNKGILKFPPDAQIQVSSNSTSQGANGAMILEGDVVITVRPPAGPRRTVKVLKTPEGVTKQDVVEESGPHLLTVRAQKVTFTRAQDGSATIQFDDGSVESN
jgi:hypothetical protein